MSTRPLQLEGRVTDPDDERARIVRELRTRVIDLAGEVEVWREKYEILRETTSKYEAAMRSLRVKLEPLYTSLRMLFGDLEVIPDDAPPAVFGGAPAASGDKWEGWKRKLGGKTAATIEALQSHPMTRAQIRVATQSGWSTVDEVTAKLRGMGLVNKVDGKFCLVEL